MKYSSIFAALLLASAAATDLNAQEAPGVNIGQDKSQDQIHDQFQDSDSMIGTEIGSMMSGGNCGLMAHRMGRMMGHRMNMRGPMMRMMFIMMDTDGDGALSLEEVQALHGSPDPPRSRPGAVREYIELLVRCTPAIS